jgi:cob(I)alamin adenosyltransferase
MSVNLYFTAKVCARIKKMQSKFMAWNEKFIEKMEEHMRKIKSFSLPCSAPVSQSFPITPQPTATITKKEEEKSC